jgi:ribosome-binding protein aMBF1 (putative translation factor)
VEAARSWIVLAGPLRQLSRNFGSVCFMESNANLGHAADDSPTLAALGRAVRRLREQEGIGVDGLADRAEIEPRELTAFEAGRLDPTYDVLIAVAEGLNVTASTLVNLASNMDD